MRLSRRGLQLALGVLWLLDGALQLQPVMFTRHFAMGIIAPAGTGQPLLVHWIVHTAAAVIQAQPVAFDAMFASVQLLLGAGLVFRRTARVALAASIAWALGVWLFGEGLGGVLGSGATLLSGAPGAAILYALVGLAAWDRPSNDRDRRSTGVVVGGWAMTWFAFAALELLLGSGSGANVAAGLTANLTGLPSPLAWVSHQIAGAALHAGALPGALIGACCVAIGILGLRAGWLRTIAAVAGGLLGLGTWVFAEGFGGISTGLATDPNSGLLVVLLALALWSRDGRGEPAATEAYRPALLPLERTGRAA